MVRLERWLEDIDQHITVYESDYPFTSFSSEIMLEFLYIGDWERSSRTPVIVMFIPEATLVELIREFIGLHHPTPSHPPSTEATPVFSGLTKCHKKELKSLNLWFRL